MTAYWQTLYVIRGAYVTSGIRYRKKWLVKRCFQSFSNSSQAGYLRPSTGFNESQCCTEFTLQDEGQIYYINLGLGQQTLQSMRLRQQGLQYVLHAISDDERGIVETITAHAANSGRDIVSRRVPTMYEIQGI